MYQAVANMEQLLVEMVHFYSRGTTPIFESMLCKALLRPLFQLTPHPKTP